MSWRCPECKSLLMDVPSGSICPNGHGGIKPKMPTAVRNYNHASLMGVRNVRSSFLGFVTDQSEVVKVDRTVNRLLRHDEIDKHVLFNGAIWRIK